MGTGKSDCRRDADSPFHEIPTISRILNISAVVNVGADEGIIETEYTDSMLKGLRRKNLGD